MIKFLEKKHIVGITNMAGYGGTYLHYVLFIIIPWPVYANELGCITVLNGAGAILVIANGPAATSSLAMASVQAINTMTP